MKRLKRRISAAFNRSDTPSAAPIRNWSLSDSMNELAERLAAEGMIIEECEPVTGGGQYTSFGRCCLEESIAAARFHRHSRFDYGKALKSCTQHWYSARHSCNPSSSPSDFAFTNRLEYFDLETSMKARERALRCQPRGIRRDYALVAGGIDPRPHNACTSHHLMRE
ncbi:hypothetical protein Tcan_14587 [Toxocara canis]|uniref:Uncharacterized protein n=1 Tax=Toxocara canis TaxID=6265 RepID=A0A0B2VVI8_TOXCA|nr:hypothetical protein Tcan_14587 [Toxocara canis]